MSNKIYITVLLFIFSFNLYSQEYKVDKEHSQFSIIGTSNIHDWSSIVKQFEFSGVISLNSISDVYFEAVVKSIESGKSGMDKNIYKALKSNDYPKIKFKSENLKIENNKISGKGFLSVAGESKEINISLGILQKNDRYIVSGTIPLRMTDYGIKPPKAVFGTIKTGDDIKLEILLSLKIKK